MLGYGLVNYFIHKFSIENIIVAFLNRMVIPNASYIVGMKVLATGITNSNAPKEYLTYQLKDLKLINSEVKDLYDLFIEDEYYITRAKIEDDESSDLEVDYQKELYKYILSANILESKDYNFDKKSKQEVITEGEQFLKIVFEKELVRFLNDVTVQFSQDSQNRILSLMEKVNNNLLFTYDPNTKLYTPSTNIKETLKAILNRYRVDIRDSNKSGFYKFYFDNNYTKIRDTYLNVLKKQISSLDDRRII